MRKTTLATTSLLADKKSALPGVNIERVISTLQCAAKWKPDLIVFPEEINCLEMDQAGKISSEEPVPDGPIQKQIAEIAKRCDINVVFGLREKDGDHSYNTGVVINRHGEFVGKYRKTHLAPGESEEGLQAGDSYPVFELDFGRVGIMICMDIHYPEPWRILALQGADVIVHPGWWMDYTGNLMESLVNARAIDNQVYVVTSLPISMPYLAGTYAGNSRIVDPSGRTLASTGHKPGIAIAEVDLDQSFEYWLTGDLKKQYPTLKDTLLGMRRPETYGLLTECNENRWKIDNPTLYAPKES